MPKFPFILKTTKIMTVEAAINTSIKRVGYTQLLTRTADDEPCGYTVGMYQTFGHPEFYVATDPELASVLFESAKGAIVAGSAFAPGSRLDQFFHPAIPAQCAQGHPHELQMEHAIRYYRTAAFPVLQIILLEE